MTKWELKNKIEKIKNRVEKMPVDDNPPSWLEFLKLDQKDFLLRDIFPQIFIHLEQETLFQCYEYITFWMLDGELKCKFVDILKEIQDIIKIEIKRHEKQIKVLRNKIYIGDMEVLNPRKDLEKETLYYISMDKTELSHNEYKLLKELGRYES